MTTDIGSPGRIQVSGLTKSFGSVTAVDRVDLTLSDQGITALIGPNGAGKTTLFDLITGQLTPTAGTVMLDGSDLTGYPAHMMARRGIGRSFQDVRLFGAMSVRENVAVYAQPPSSGSVLRTATNPFRQRRISRRASETALEMLDYLGISHLGNVRADSLGFAQQKLVAIARLLALRPQMLFLDEPASGLDHAGRDVLTATIKQLAADGFAVCFVEHNTHLVREVATRVVFLSQGRVLADGDTERVFADPRLAEAYLGLV
jgi:ABC-type branched-subunit amino acid transport system ATPase component